MVTVNAAAALEAAARAAWAFKAATLKALAACLAWRAKRGPANLSVVAAARLLTAAFP